MFEIEIVIIAVLVIVLVLALGATAYLVVVLLEKNKRLVRYRSIADLEDEQEKVKKETDRIVAKNEELMTSQARLQERKEAYQKEIEGLKKEVGGLEDEREIQDYGLYEPKYDFDSSEEYKSRLDKNRKKQKRMVRDKEAVASGTNWHVSGSKTKGRQMINEQIKLMLRAFNGECDSLILKVKHNNVDRIESRIDKLYEAINKLGKSKDCWINRKYLELKLEELYLVHEYQEKRQEEIEEQRRIREQMREEARVRREIEKAQKEAEKDEERYEKALKQARQEIVEATGEKQEKLQTKITELTEALEEAHAKKERAISRAQMTKAGHVYVISNIGSFGQDVYKIGLTRRLEPLDRVKELGDASVPFPFDIHAMIYSEDAPGLEGVLHKAFHDKRVNRINERKEFFRVNLDEIKEAILEQHGQIEFTLMAQAKEYRETQAMVARENGQPKTGEQPTLEVETKPEGVVVSSSSEEVLQQQLKAALTLAQAGNITTALQQLDTLQDIWQESGLPPRKQAELCVAQAICYTKLGKKHSSQGILQRALALGVDSRELKAIADQQGWKPERT